MDRELIPAFPSPALPRGAGAARSRQLRKPDMTRTMDILCQTSDEDARRMGVYSILDINRGVDHAAIGLAFGLSTMMLGAPVRSQGPAEKRAPKPTAKRLKVIRKRKLQRQARKRNRK